MNSRESSIGPTWIRRIVVAADGSPASVRGLEQATDLAVRVGAKVVVVHVRHIPTMAMAGPTTSEALMLDSLDELESEVRQQAVRILGTSGASWDFIVRSGSAGEEIVKVASEMGADIVVVGSNRHSSLHNLLLGSTAAYLTAHSPVPVLVMRSLVPAEVAHSR
jgi:nucleotide-binding universal stress UspA family protein